MPDIEKQQSSRLDDIDVAEQRVRMTVQAVDEYAGRVHDLPAELALEQVIWEIDPGLGTVIVAGDGHILDVAIDGEAARLSRIDLLGERIMHAIKSAEDNAKELRKARLAEISASVHLEG